jgi:tungstate transport system permease protein
VVPVQFLLEQIREAWRLMGYDPQLRPLIDRTLHLALEATALALVLGALPAYVIGTRRTRGSRWALVLANAGLGLPPVAVGIFLIPLLPGHTPWGGVWFQSMNGMIYAQTVLALPIIVALSATAIRGLPEGLLDQARACGASGWRLGILAFREARIGVLTAVIFALGSAIAEVGAVTVVGGNNIDQTTTLSSEILNDFSGHGFTGRAALGGLTEGLEHAMVVLSLLLILAAILTSVQQWGKLKQRRRRMGVRAERPASGPAVPRAGAL